MQRRAIAQILTASVTVTLVIAAAIFTGQNDKALLLLDTALSHHDVERISMGSVFWDFRTLGTDHLVFIPPARLQKIFTAALCNVQVIQNDPDQIYWLLVFACFLPSLTLCAFMRPQTGEGAFLKNSYPWSLAPVFISLLMYSLGLGIDYHTKDAQITMQLRPGFNAVAIERWPLDGSCPAVWVSHLRNMSICTHKTSTCAGHICNEQCKLPYLDLRTVAADSCFPFDTIRD